jgi:peptidoglycan/LPS O-acetylase OafA/YrhL
MHQAARGSGGGDDRRVVMIGALPSSVSAFARSGFVLPPGAFRLVLALAVVASHVTPLDIGRLAVLAFFFLSGFWSSRIWAQKFGSGATLRFYAARWLRIAPLYLLVLLTWAAIRGTPLHPENFTLFGVATTDRDPLRVSWSLDIELQFYLLLPLLFGLVAEASAGLTILGALAMGAAGCWCSRPASSPWRNTCPCSPWAPSPT